MYVSKPLATKVAMSVLTSIPTAASLLGNGFILAVVSRFKKLRTVPNILVANLALVDLLNSIVNTPLAIMSVLEVNWFKGRTLAILANFPQRLFTALNLVSMLVMMANVYLAIAFDLRYLAWKAKKKTLICCFLIWLIDIVAVSLHTVPLLDINLGDASVHEYRTEIFKRGKYFSVTFFTLSIISLAVLGFLTSCAIKKKKTERAALQLPPLQAESRHKSDLKAKTTIAITIAAYFICYAPCIAYAVRGLQEESQTEYWLAFLVWYILSLSSAVNPMIYYLRTNRFRYALNQFIKDPFGTSEFKEKSSGNSRREERKNNELRRKWDGERAISGDGSRIQTDGNQSRQKYSAEKVNEVLILSFDLEDNACLQKTLQNKGSDEAREQNGQDLESKDQIQKPSEGIEEEREKINGELFKRSGAQKRSRKQQRSSSGKKVELLRIENLDINEDPSREGRDDSALCSQDITKCVISPGKRRNAVTGQSVCKVIRKAWGEDENERE